MAPSPKRSQKAVEKPPVRGKPILDEMLDEALEETFPASDPVSLNQPGHGPSRAGGEPANAATAAVAPGRRHPDSPE